MTREDLAERLCKAWTGIPIPSHLHNYNCGCVQQYLMPIIDEYLLSALDEARGQLAEVKRQRDCAIERAARALTWGR